MRQTTEDSQSGKKNGLESMGTSVETDEVKALMMQGAALAGSGSGGPEEGLTFVQTGTGIGTGMGGVYYLVKLKELIIYDFKLQG